MHTYIHTHTHKHNIQVLKNKCKVLRPEDLHLVGRGAIVDYIYVDMLFFFLTTQLSFVLTHTHTHTRALNMAQLNLTLLNSHLYFFSSSPFNCNRQLELTRNCCCDALISISFVNYMHNKGIRLISTVCICMLASLSFSLYGPFFQFCHCTYIHIYVLLLLLLLVHFI